MGKQSQDANPDLLTSRALLLTTWLHCPSSGRWEEGHVQAEGTACAKARWQEGADVDLSWMVSGVHWLCPVRGETLGWRADRREGHMPLPQFPVLWAHYLSQAQHRQVLPTHTPPSSSCSSRGSLVPLDGDSQLWHSEPRRAVSRHATGLAKATFFHLYIFQIIIYFSLCHCRLLTL